MNTNWLLDWRIGGFRALQDAWASSGTVSAFTDGADGTLSPIGASPFPDYQTAPCWLEISHDGQYVFAVNTPSMSVSGRQRPA